MPRPATRMNTEAKRHAVVYIYAKGRILIIFSLCIVNFCYFCRCFRTLLFVPPLKVLLD